MPEQEKQDTKRPPWWAGELKALWRIARELSSKLGKRMERINVHIEKLRLYKAATGGPTFGLQNLQEYRERRGRDCVMSRAGTTTYLKWAHWDPEPLQGCLLPGWVGARKTWRWETILPQTIDRVANGVEIHRVSGRHSSRDQGKIHQKPCDFMGKALEVISS